MSSLPLRVQVMGGLGNQLHGLAAGVAIAGYFQRELIVDTSRVSFGSNLSRIPELHSLKLDSCEVQITFEAPHLGRRKIWHEKVRRRSKGVIKSKISFDEPSYKDNFQPPYSQIVTMNPEVFSIGGPFIDFGWANEAQKYGFPQVCSPLSGSIDYEEQLSKITKESLAIHVRLGDYLNHTDIFPIASENFYLNAISQAGANSFDEIVVFTDSPRLFPLKYPKIAENKKTRVMNSHLNTVETLSLMSRYETLVGSNSTFSSWAGWFSSPKTMFTPVPHLRDGWEDHLPASWIRLPIA